MASSSVMAADMPVKAPPLVAPTWSWSGFYAGANAGIARSRTRTGDYNGPLIPAFIFDPGIITLVPGTIGTLPGTRGHDTSWLAGGQIGHNWQSGRAVFGIEVDAVATGLKDAGSSTASRFDGTPQAQTVRVAYATDIDWMVSVRGRLGYTAAERLLLYVTGGGAFARIDAGGTASATFGPGTLIPAPGTYTLTSANAVTRVGWTGGLGLEWASGSGWRFGVEYRHTDFGRVATAVQIPDGLGTVFGNGTASTRVTIDQVTARVNWAFGPR
jgi:outer membrane immunogenic protein